MRLGGVRGSRLPPAAQPRPGGRRCFMAPPVRLLFALVLVLASAVSLAPASPDPARAAPAPQAPTALTVGYLPVSIAAPLYLAVEKGYFAEQGLSIDLQLFASGAEVLTSTAGGQL